MTFKSYFIFYIHIWIIYHDCENRIGWDDRREREADKIGERERGKGGERRERVGIGGKECEILRFYKNWIYDMILI